jgi:hypothetical protein
MGSLIADILILKKVEAKKGVSISLEKRKNKKGVNGTRNCKKV